MITFHKESISNVRTDDYTKHHSESSTADQRYINEIVPMYTMTGVTEQSQGWSHNH